MAVKELQDAWVAYRSRVADEYGEWDERRLAAIPEYLETMNGFLGGNVDVREFRSRIDSLGKSQPLFGFGGTSQMFFNQLVNAAEPDALDIALKSVLPAPADEADAREKLERFCAAVEASREHAESLGVTQPGVGRVATFVSFFWELQDREQWPRFFPNSRDLLEQHGLLDTNQGQPELYLAYRSVLAELKDRLGVDTWTLEHLLWHLGDGGKRQDPPKKSGEKGADPNGNAASNDLYASYREQGLHFPDEVVTSLVLSLATKRFVILSGISGTGKTRIALGLAEHLERTNATPPADVEPPEQDARNLYFRLTAPKLKRGYVSLGSEAREHFERALEVPARGSSRFYETRLPDGATHRTRLNNIGFADSSRTMFRLYLRKDITEWLQANAKPGDFLHLELTPDDQVEIQLSLTTGTAVPADDSRRHATIAVRSDWTDPRGLVGYFNPLTSSYVRTELIELLLRAGDDPENPYVAVLDEMNLARVEYYFSDFLSALESGEPLRLMAPGEADENTAASDEASEVDLPAELEIPANVSFVGTVNVDETTHPFSPKVLDRANVLEFNEVDVERALGHGDKSSAPGLRLAGGILDPSWLCTEKDAAQAPQSLAHETDAFTGALEDVHGILALYNLHFGYRVIGEISAFVGHALEKADSDAAEVTRLAFDLQLRQKIIPKLSGGRELEEPLARLLDYCLDGQRKATVEIEAVRAAARERLDPGSATSAPMYPGSARKLLRMLDRVAEAGFVGALE